jgi:tricorn protease
MFKNIASLLLGAAVLASSPDFALAAPAPAKAAPTANAPADDATKLIRFPDIHGDTIVFCHGGDIWKVSAKGGTATQLTTHPGLEMFPKFSPDGKWIAFTGQYDGDEQVYVIPVEGGKPRQLTYYPSGAPMTPLGGSDNLVYGWTPDGKSVFFRSVRDANAVTELGTLYTVPFEGGLPKKVGMPSAGVGDFSPDGTKIVYSPHFRDFRAWKRYEGGLTQYLTIFDLKTKTIKRLDNARRSEREPIWIGDKIYFTSDRTGTMNIFEYDTKTEKIVQLTHEKQWDVRWASGEAAGKIVYELAGELVVFDTRATDNDARFTKIKIRVPHDGLAMRPTRKDVSGRIESFAAAPGAKRAAVTARGDLFTLPVDKGYVKNLTNSSDAYEHAPVWSRDGKTLAYLSDKSGEDQIWLQDSRAEKPPVQLTHTFKVQLERIQFSPCGRWLAVSDCQGTLWIVAVTKGDAHFKRGVPVRVATAKDGGVGGADWSPCGAYLAFTVANPTGFAQLRVYDLATRKTRPVTDPLFDVREPAWDPSGKYLWYLSRREFAPQHSSVEWNFAGNRDTGIFGLLLRKDVASPFGPQFGDEPEAPKKDAAKKHVAAATAKGAKDVKAAKTAKDSKASKSKATAAKAPKPTAIDWDGLATRVVRVPVAAENYNGLSAGDKFLYYVRNSAGYYGREPEAPSRILAYDIKERKESVLLAGTGSYSLAPDYSHIVVNHGGLKSLPPAPGGNATSIKTDGMAADSIPALEWEEIYRQAWRKYRDFFYVRNMHGLDWEALRKQYAALLPHVSHRADLSYVLVELVGELSISHSYVQGGEYYQPKRPASGLPGARFELDEESGRYRISKIYRGQNEESRYRSPLTEPGVNAKVGDYVLAIDGTPLTAADNPYRLLLHRTDPVTLTLNDKPTTEGARKTTYVPVGSEGSLRYLDFVLTSHERVSKATGGRVGYFHIPDMGAPGAYEFIKWYYPQIRKEGLVIDARGNRGGNISQWIITRLNQKLLATRFGGPGDELDTYPDIARHGYQVCLINANAGSDGDIFPWNFRKAGLGPLIGKRTWGGVVGISGVGSLLDGGKVTVPLRGTNDTDGRWIIENRGVAPDIDVENDPKSMIAGVDPQLERGIVEVMKKVTASPKKWPKRPADPVKKK